MTLMNGRINEDVTVIHVWKPNESKSSSRLANGIDGDDVEIFILNWILKFSKEIQSVNIRFYTSKREER